MDKKQATERIAEFAGTYKNAGKDEKSLLETALFIEDEFDIVLSDHEICEKNLGEHHALEEFVLEKLHWGKRCVESVE